MQRSSATPKSKWRAPIIQLVCIASDQVLGDPDNVGGAFVKEALPFEEGWWTSR